MEKKDIKKKEILSLFSDGNDVLFGHKTPNEVTDFIKKTSIPDEHDEEWKKTDLSILLKHKFIRGIKQIVPDEFVDTFSFYGLESHRIVFVNGFFSEENSSNIHKKTNVYIGSLKNAKIEKNKAFLSTFNTTELHKDNFFTAINTAYSEDGAYINIPDNTIVDKPIHLVNFIHGNNNKVLSQSRNLVIVGKNSQVKIISSYHSLTTDFTFNNVGTEIIARENSNIEYYLFEGEGNEASHFNNIHVDQYEGSCFKANTATLCGALVRNDIHVDFKGEHCEVDLQGLYLPDKEQFAENFVEIKHSKPNCNSKQLYKGIIDNKARSVFVGKVFVAPDAQKTDASQSNKNLLLSDNAKAYSRPQLEIYTDDVSCAHGSTTGQIDKEALFYLKTRGIPEKRAKILLMSAFVKDIIDKIEIKPYRDYVNYLVNKRLKGQKVEGLCAVKICPNC